MRSRICLFALCFLILHCSAIYGQTTKKAERSAEWEYKQLFSPLDLTLNHYAKDGWEIAAAAGGGGEGGFDKIILKRSRSHPLFGTKTAEPPKPAPLPTPSNCKLTLAQAPVIRGLRLGMTSDELFTIFPANEQTQLDRAQKLKSAELAPHFGYASFQFSISEYPTLDGFTGIGLINIGFLDRKVVSIDASYFNAPKYDRDLALGAIVRQYGFPDYKNWPGYNTYLPNPSLSCDGFAFRLYGSGNSLSINLRDSMYEKIVEDRKHADLVKKWENFKL